MDALCDLTISVIRFAGETIIAADLRRIAPHPSRPLALIAAPRVDSGKGQNRTLRPLSALWPPVFAGEQDVGPPKG